MNSTCHDITQASAERKVQLNGHEALFANSWLRKMKKSRQAYIDGGITIG